jgi:hypothetical protein
MGNSWHLELKDNKIELVTCECQYLNEKKKSIEPTSDQWACFKMTLDELNVWNWRKHYDNPGILDGEGWDLDIVWGDRSICSFGDNNYPKKDASPSNNAGATSTFNKYIKAIKQLLGGMELK